MKRYHVSRTKDQVGNVAFRPLKDVTKSWDRKIGAGAFSRKNMKMKKRKNHQHQTNFNWRELFFSSGWRCLLLHKQSDVSIQDNEHNRQPHRWAELLLNEKFHATTLFLENNYRARYNQEVSSNYSHRQHCSLVFIVITKERSLFSPKLRGSPFK